MSTSEKRSGRERRPMVNVHQACAALDKLAPPALAQGWDNVGLLAGDLNAEVQCVMLCIDLMPEVVDEAVGRQVQMVMAYHPPIFKPVPRLVSPAPAPEAAVHQCIAAGIAVYSMHTALDAAEGGTNDGLAELCGILHTEPLEHTTVGRPAYKVAVFVPVDDVDRVAQAMFAVGAGRIGDYEQCSFRLRGTGTFFGTDSTCPTIGKAGRLERVPEVRLEVLCPADRLPAVVEALVQAHSYEEPAYDIYPLQSPPVRGIGRIGRLPRPLSLGALARKLKRSAPAACVSVVGDPGREVERAVFVVGAAGQLPFQMPLTDRDVIVTGEIRHHDALAILRRECCAIALGHWSSERPALAPLAARLSALLPGVEVLLSQADREPFQRV